MDGLTVIVMLGGLAAVLAIWILDLPANGGPQRSDWRHEQ